MNDCEKSRSNERENECVKVSVASRLFFLGRICLAQRPRLPPKQDWTVRPYSAKVPRMDLAHSDLWSTEDLGHCDSFWKASYRPSIVISMSAWSFMICWPLKHHLFFVKKNKDKKRTRRCPSRDHCPSWLLELSLFLSQVQNDFVIDVPISCHKAENQTKNSSLFVSCRNGRRNQR